MTGLNTSPDRPANGVGESAPPLPLNEKPISTIGIPGHSS